MSWWRGQEPLGQPFRASGGSWATPPRYISTSTIPGILWSLLPAGIVPSLPPSSPQCYLTVDPRLKSGSSSAAEGSSSAKSSRQVRQVRTTPKSRFAPSCPVGSVASVTLLQRQWRPPKRSWDPPNPTSPCLARRGSSNLEHSCHGADPREMIGSV